MEESTLATKTESTLGVGIIGVSPVRGWAATAHIPALRALPNYEIRALSGHSAESARAAGEAFGVSAVFSDPKQLVSQPDIDVVAVTVKVPHHREFVSAALAAGKAVYCEWPLGRDLDDARAMAALATKQGVRTVVGLQARQAPAIQFVQELLADGYVGEVLSTTMVGLSVPGNIVSQPNAYMLNRTNGANALTISAGHCTMATEGGGFLDFLPDPSLDGKGYMVAADNRTVGGTAMEQRIQPFTGPRAPTNPLGDFRSSSSRRRCGGLAIAHLDNTR